MAGMILINKDRCKGCAICTSVCPKNILSIDCNATNIKGYNPVFITNMDTCIACGNCGRICPDSAIIVIKN